MLALILTLHFLIHPLNQERVIYSCSYTNCVANISNIAVHFTTAKPITVQQIMRSNGKITPNMFIKPEVVAITGVPLSFSFIKTATQQALLQMQKQGVIESRDANSVQFPPLDISGF